jgi:hypothetical protein
MKPHLSVLMLVARSTIYKIVGLLLLLALVDGVLFHFALGPNQIGTDRVFTSLEYAFARSRISVAFGVSFLVMTVLLERTGYASGGKPGYTLRRLSISERSVFVWQALYNTSCYVMLWAAQLFTALALCRLYLLRADPALTSGQTVFLAFYRNAFLHNLLPLGEVSRWVSNIAVIIGFGVTSASIPFGRRRGKAGASEIVRAMFALVFFNRELGIYGYDIFLSLFGLTMTGVAIYRVWRGDTEADDEHES